MLSYLLGLELREVTGFYDGEGNVVDEFHASAELAGPRHGDKDVYVLIGEHARAQPTTQANWEGIGVQPDLDVPVTEAFDTAAGAAQG